MSRLSSLFRATTAWRTPLVCLLLSCLGVLTAAPVDQELDSIAVGTVYNLFHEEYATDAEFFAQVDRDIPAMKAAGLTHVLLFPMNQWDPETRTRLWTRTDYVVKKIEETGLRFVPLMLKEEQCSHYVPLWKYRELPQLAAHLRVDGGRNTRENVDFADPAVYPLVEDNFAAVVARYGASPALAFYNIWNEPHYDGKAPHVVARFRDWLKTRYGSLPALRRAWGKEYTTWEEVTPFLNDDWNSSLPAIDWRLFRGELNGRLLGQLADTLRRLDPKHAINANPVGAPWAGGGEPGGYNTDNWQFTAYNDFNGLSYYPEGWEFSHPGQVLPLWQHNLSFNVVRCAAGEKGYLLTELYTNAKNGLSLSGYVDKTTMHRVSWAAFANNSKGILYWKWEPFLRGRQSLGRGLVRLDGVLAPRGEAVRDIASVMKRHGSLLLHAKPVAAQVGILLDQAGLLKTLDQPNDPRTRSFMTESHAGLFKALDEANTPVDVLRSDLCLTAAQLRSYRLLFLPFQILVSHQTAALLRDYVREGGTLVADARSATIDELDIAFRVSPGAGLDEVFGATRLDWTGSLQFHQVRTKIGPDSTALTFGGRWFREQLLVRPESKIVGRFLDTEEPALVSHSFGKGLAFLSAVPLGASYYEQPDNQVNRVLLDFCRVAGVQVPASFVSATGQGVSIRVHKAADGSLVVYLLHSGTSSLAGTLSLPLQGVDIRELRSLLDDQVLPFTIDKGTLSVRLEIPVEGVRVLQLVPRR